MFGPLSFSDASKEDSPPLSNEDTESALCILCPEQCPSQNELLTHIFVSHKMVIADVPLIADLKLYLDYWRVKLQQVGVSDVCTGIQMNGELYHLLSDVLPEDRMLRQGLHIKRMERALGQQETERLDSSYSVQCMFCRHEMSPTRSVYIQHLAEHHNVQLGPVETLVYIDKLLDLVQRQIDNLKCLFCERTYKSRDVLKEHMRKKGHKRLNPHNEMYDQFYIDSYREMDRSWKNNKRRPVPSSSSTEPPSAGSEDESAAEDSDWSDWTEPDSCDLVCLFCDVRASAWKRILDHLQAEHGFDFLTAVKHLDFYRQVKLVNYLRREIYWNSCPVCKTKFQTKLALYAHIKQENHAVLPEETYWNCPEYFFPTYENDAFLCQLDDGEEDIVEEILEETKSKSSQDKIQEDKSFSTSQTKQMLKQLRIS
uniref:Zinc finger protein 277 n=1 Tax=Cacopsylla melanoneura TaxID=428564 RepID=A0A8D9ESB5_9HEMI